MAATRTSSSSAAGTTASSRPCYLAQGGPQAARPRERGVRRRRRRHRGVRTRASGARRSSHAAGPVPAARSCATSASSSTASTLHPDGGARLRAGADGGAHRALRATPRARPRELERLSPHDAKRLPRVRRDASARSAGSCAPLLPMTPPSIDEPSLSASSGTSLKRRPSFRGLPRRGRLPAAALGADGGRRPRRRVVRDRAAARDRRRARHLRHASPAPGRPARACSVLLQAALGWPRGRPGDVRRAAAWAR